MTHAINTKVQKRNRAVQNLYRAQHLLEGLTTAGATEFDTYYKAAKGLVEEHTKILADIDGDSVLAKGSVKEVVAKKPTPLASLQAGEHAEGLLKGDFNRGFTFLEVKGYEDVFLHISAVPEEMQGILKMGDTVQFVAGENDRGVCANVQLPRVKEAKSRELKRAPKKSGTIAESDGDSGGHSGWRPMFEALESMTAQTQKKESVSA